MDVALERTDRLLIFPIETDVRSGFSSSFRVISEHQLAADGTHTTIRKICCELADHRGMKGLPDVAEDNDVARGVGHGTVKRRRLSAMRSRFDDCDSLGREASNKKFRAVRRAIQRNDDLQLVFWILERKTVLDFLLQP